ncbi:MAG: hypothetical protein NDI84_06955, partial [Steroidobacteraceae bacterium]|nr:hypothetical protein [Steroidobacteraceae bacterium]
GEDGGQGIEVAIAGTSLDAYFGLAFDGDAAVAVGARGAVATSTDGGITWQASESAASDVALLAVAAHDAHRMAVGQLGRVIVSSGGGPWTAVSSGTDQRLFGVDFNASGVAAIAGSFGTILVSEDGGTTWRTSTTDWTAVNEFGAAPHLYDAHVDETGAITLVGEFGLVMRSADRGATWQVLNKGEASLFDLELRPDGVGFAVGQQGTLLRTGDGGQTWTAVDTGSEKILLGVSSTPGGRVVVCGMRTLLVSEDGGATWHEDTRGDFAMSWYQRVKAFDGDRAALVAGHAGRIVSIRGSRAPATPGTTKEENRNEST